MRQVMLLGDSIRLGYQPVVVEALPEWSVQGPEENCRSSRDLRAGLESWLLRDLATPTFVHVNAGLHDLRRCEDTSWGPLIPRRDYRVNLRAIFGGLARHPFVGVGRVIVATTTPVDADRHNTTKQSHRHQADVVAYNEVLIAEAQRHAFPVNDLCDFVLRSPQDLLSADGVHLTTEGYRRLGWHVAEAVRRAAAARGA